MSAYASGAALPNKAVEILKTNQSGLLTCKITAGAAAVMIGFYRKIANKFSMTSSEAKRSQYVTDQSTLENTPVMPGSVQVSGTGIPTLIDRDKDGILYEDRSIVSPLVTGKADGVTSAAASKQFTSATGGFVVAGVRAGDKLVLACGLDKGIYTIASRDSATQVTITAPWPVGGQTTVTYEIWPVDNVRGTINYFTGLMDLTYPSGDAPDGHATVVGTGTFPLNLEPGQTLTANVDGGGATAATFAAAAATLDGSGGSFAAMASETMQVRFKVGGTWGEWQTITFGTEATQQLAVDLMNAQMSGGYAVINGANVDIISDGKGTGASVATQNVAAGITTKLGIANDDSDNGTGDVSDINSVTFAEAKAVVEADIAGALLELDGGYPRLSSDTAEVGSNSTIQVTAGSANAAFGFDTDAHAGDDADARIGATCTYMSTASIGANQTVIRQVVNTPNDDLAVYVAAQSPDSSIIKVEIQ